MCRLLFIRLLFICNLLHVGELLKCTKNSNDKNLKVRNRWSPWSDWSPCTRPCGIGIQHRNRTCLQTRRKRRKHCNGQTSTVRVCNLQDCTDDRPDLLTEQCSAFNNRTFAGKKYTWLPFLHLGRECSLHCRPLGERFFAELSPLVADGTRCGKNSYCYKGRCLVAGCNYVLGHDGKTDCETCDDGKTSYRRIAGIYALPNLDYGYNYVTTIPNAAINISISQIGSTPNHLALKRNDGSFIVNGNWYANQPGQYPSCGTTFTYRIEHDTSKYDTEYIRSPGPLSEPVQLMLWTTQINTGIRYEYEIPISNGASPDVIGPINNAAFQSKHTVIQHRVQHGNNDTINISIQDTIVNRQRHRKTHFIWKSCFKSCGNGVYKSAVCIQLSNEMIVPDTHCSRVRKPIQDDYQCNVTQIILPEWVPMEWSSCTATCGEGLQRRNIVCKQFSSLGYPTTVRGIKCLSEQPETERKCIMTPCLQSVVPESWQVGPWSQCSCDLGIRSRQVICKSNLCSEDVPPSQESCNPDCQTNVGMWLTSPWDTECSETCGDGWQMRKIICFGQGQCIKSERPNDYRRCNRNEGCSGQWYQGPWNKCTGVCMNGEQNREVLCLRKLHSQLVIVPHDNCKDEEKPVSTRKCQLPECPPMWYTSNWSICSRSCGTGMQYRDVFCLKDSDNSTLCHHEEKPPTAQPCNTHSCNALMVKGDENQICEDKLDICPTAVVQARLCTYQYYQTHCCRACYKK